MGSIPCHCNLQFLYHQSPRFRKLHDHDYCTPFLNDDDYGTRAWYWHSHLFSSTVSRLYFHLSSISLSRFLSLNPLFLFSLSLGIAPSLIGTLHYEPALTTDYCFESFESHDEQKRTLIRGLSRPYLSPFLSLFLCVSPRGRI